MQVCGTPNPNSVALANAASGPARASHGPPEREGHWREPVLDALALVRASITYDREAQRVLLAHSEPDLVRDWLLNFARAWLLEWAGLREVGADAAVGGGTRLPGPVDGRISRRCGMTTRASRVRPA